MRRKDVEVVELKWPVRHWRPARDFLLLSVLKDSLGQAGMYQNRRNFLISG
jgi:hypothetical protein